MADTNDLRSGLEGVAAELSSYYEIAYVPPVADADGRFHRTEVKLSRPGMTVRSRRGYQALPPDAPETLPWELALAQALAQDPPPRAFEHRAAALRFADADERTEVAILVDVPLWGIVVRRDEAAGVYRAHLQVLAHVGNEAGRVVARLSHDWPLEGPLAEAEAVKGESLQVRRSVRLAPGRYTLETAVLDGLADEHSVGRRLRGGSELWAPRSGRRRGGASRGRGGDGRRRRPVPRRRREGDATPRYGRTRRRADAIGPLDRSSRQRSRAGRCHAGVPQGREGGGSLDSEPGSSRRARSCRLRRDAARGALPRPDATS